MGNLLEILKSGRICLRVRREAVLWSILRDIRILVSMFYLRLNIREVTGGNGRQQRPVPAHTF